MAILAAIALWGGAKSELKSQLMDLLPNNDPYIVEYKNALNNFKGMGVIIVAVEGKKNNIVKFIPVAAKELSKVNGIGNVTYENAVNFLKKNGLTSVI